MQADTRAKLIGRNQESAVAGYNVKGSATLAE